MSTNLFFPVIDIIVSSLSLGQYLHSPSGTTSSLPNLTDEDVITPAAKLPGKTTLHLGRSRKGVRELLLPPEPRVMPLEDPLVKRRQVDTRTLTPPALPPLLFSIYCFLLPRTASLYCILDTCQCNASYGLLKYNMPRVTW
jgi:hypothetical protein